MANEIKVTVNGTVTNGKYSNEFKPGTLSFDQAAVGAHAPVVSVGTSEEDLSIGDVSTPGWLFLRNLDATNYVDYGGKSTGGTMVALGRIKAGDVAVLRMNPSATLRWKANTSAVKVQALLLES